LWNFLGAKKLKEVQFAHVGTEPLFDKNRFGEMAATNRGFNVKMFDNVDAAINWLGSGSTKDLSPGRSIAQS